jgi:hypothetical protein
MAILTNFFNNFSTEIDKFVTETLKLNLGISLNAIHDGDNESGSKPTTSCPSAVISDTVTPTLTPFAGLTTILPPNFDGFNLKATQSSYCAVNRCILIIVDVSQTGLYNSYLRPSQASLEVFE